MGGDSHRAQRDVRDVILGGAQIASTALLAAILRRRYNRWGATPAELGARIPGDDLVPHPRLGYTRAITINAPVDAVWPWLAQIGQGRGSLYSFDGLENLVRCASRDGARGTVVGGGNRCSGDNGTHRSG